MKTKEPRENGGGKIGRFSSSLLSKFRGLKLWKKAGVVTGLFAALVAVVLIFDLLGIRAASYGWLQTDWSGGADTVNYPTHTDDQSGWTKYYSKDANVDVTSSPGDIKLTATEDTSTQTSDDGTGDTPDVGGFDAWTTDSNSYVAGTGADASLTLLKPDGAACTAGAECACGQCLNSTCTLWYTGYCGVEVYYTNSANSTWQPGNISCTGPQCVLGLDSQYPTKMGLVADNDVDFSAFPARDACKSIGARLPYMDELICMWTNRNNIGMGSTGLFNYFSGTEATATSAYRKYWYNGLNATAGKTSTQRVRCVRD